MEPGDVAWVLASAALVMFMTPGLAFFYGGMDRSRNVLNMLMMNFWCLLIVPVVWVVIGYSIAQGGASGWFGGFDLAFLNGMDLSDGGEGLVFVAFLGMFAVITPALISGAVADRMKFTAWAIFVPLWLVAVFAPIFQWVYGGWLAERGSLDFAGGTAIHVNAGVAALVLAVVLGRRRGWPGERRPPHNMPLVMLGAGILWFGWFGFNAGSAGAANGQAIQAFLNTFVAAAAAGLAWVTVEKVKDGHVTTLGAASGVVAGLVAITPAAGYVTTFPSIVIGLLAGVACLFAIQLKFRFGYDDSLDVVGVHLVGGLVGSVLIGVFADPEFFGSDHLAGLVMGGGTELLGEQVLANVAAMLWCAAITAVLALGLKATVGLRVSAEVEAVGLDILEHAETAYDFFDSAVVETAVVETAVVETAVVDDWDAPAERDASPVGQSSV